MNRPIAPLYAIVNVTGICNLKCVYCYDQPRKHEVMSWKNFEKVIIELHKNQLFMLVISGGEPFSHPQICDFLLLAHEKFENVITLSNGTILNQKHLTTIKEIIQNKGVFPIQVSIDSIYPDINNMTRCDPTLTMKNIQILSDIGANVVISTVITKFNIDTIQESITVLSKYTRIFHLIPFEPALSLEKRDLSYRVEEDKLYDFLKSIVAFGKNHNLIIDTPIEEETFRNWCASGAPCQAAFSLIVIDPNLQVRPCDRLTDTIIGNLSKSSLKDIWGSKAALNVVNQPVSLCLKQACASHRARMCVPKLAKNGFYKKT
jgi:radical SAM protein with 4Fe4S-binding SPASM domain